jgi:hypothetical protein
MSEYEGNGNPFTKADPTITEFRTEFNKLANEIVCEKYPTPEDYIGSHKIPSSVRVRVVNDDVDEYYDIVGLAVDQLCGCGCWSGVVIEIRKT